MYAKWTQSLLGCFISFFILLNFFIKLKRLPNITWEFMKENHLPITDLSSSVLKLDSFRLLMENPIDKRAFLLSLFLIYIPWNKASVEKLFVWLMYSYYRICIYRIIRSNLKIPASAESNPQDTKSCGASRHVVNGGL